VSVRDTACVPERPSSQRCCAGDAGGVGLEEVELVGWVMVDGTGDENEKGEEKAACDEDERDEREDRSCGLLEWCFEQVDVWKAHWLVTSWPLFTRELGNP